jgi:pilus assembly protein CpaB
MRALTIAVNEIVGVAGFILPGDHVDIILIMSSTGGGKAQSKASYLMQNVRVLAIDQRAAEDVSEPKVVNAVTVSVTPVDAQKLALASHVGKLVLTLRGTDNALRLALATITIDQLLGKAAAPLVVASKPTAITTMRRRGPRRLPRLVNVNIIRALKRSKQKVISERWLKTNSSN